MVKRHIKNCLLFAGFDKTILFLGLIWFNIVNINNRPYNLI